MFRFFLLLTLLTLSVYGQFIVWDTDHQAWCTDWSTLQVLSSKLNERCNNLRYDFRVNINTGTQMERGCCFEHASGLNMNQICSGWRSTTTESPLKIDVIGCVNSNLSVETKNNQARVCC